MKQKDIDALFKQYALKKDPEIKQVLIAHYVYLVKLVGGRLGIYLNQYVDLDDLVGYGVIGLIDAIEKFDFAKNVKFETYASLRIRGAILDAIRKLDWVPRTLRKKQKDLSRAYTEIEAELGRAPTEEEMAKYLDLELSEYYTLLSDTNICTLVSIDEHAAQMETIKDAKAELPDESLEEKEMIQILTDEIDNLPEREKKVITLYYFEELTLKEISSILEVSESRVSQIHTKGVSRLRMKLEKHNIILPL
ncbi:MAG: FliA/WhiG family RNA polymerase sigma factor [Cellulosilyticaceae bacterium]